MSLNPKQWFRIEPLAGPAASAAAYVPMVMVSRALAFLRTLLVARVLGEQGKPAFGLYQPALEFINPLVVLVMFGAADVAERYVARIERERGDAGLRAWLSGQLLRVGLAGILALLLLSIVSGWISNAVWGERHAALVIACAATVIVLALYQHLSAVLRGLRSYSAAAGMEVIGASLLLVLSVIAAFRRNAVWLIVAYGLSVLIPWCLYMMLLRRHLARPAEAPPQSPAIPAADRPHLTRFAAWSMVRLLLVMLFGFLSLWGVRYLAAGQAHDPSVRTQEGPLSITAQYAMPYRIAQLLGFVAVTLWASSYAIAARAWSHGQVKRAKVQLFRTGKAGAALLTLAALALLLARGLFAWLLKDYATAILDLLPGLLTVFMWYGLVAFFSTLSDLREQPHRGAALWGLAVFVQIIGIFHHRHSASTDSPMQAMLDLSAISLAAPLLVLAPPLLCRPLRFSATGVPLVILGFAAGALLSPPWVVDWIAPPVMAAALLFLLASGLLFRPVDKRAIRRLLTPRSRELAAKTLGPQRPESH